MSHTLNVIIYWCGWYAVCVALVALAVLAASRYMDRQAAAYWADPYTTDELEALYRMPAARR